MFSAIILVLCLFPYFYLLSQFPAVSRIDGEELLWAVTNSAKQAGLSALFASLLGFILALGLNRLASQATPWARRLDVFLQTGLLLPSLLPPVFIILTFLSWVQPFPFGIAGIVIVQTPIMAGFAAVTLRRQMADKVAELALVAEVLGAGRWLFWRKSFPLLQRDLLTTAGFLFVWAFTSFSIPVVLGGGRGTTLEILIYEKIRISGDWGAALSLALVQSFLVGGMMVLLPTANVANGGFTRGPGHSRLLQSKIGLGLAAIMVASFVLPWLMLSWSGWGYIFSAEGVLPQALQATWLSLRLGLFAGGLHLVVLILFARASFSSWIRLFLRAYFAPSMALLGLCGLGLQSWLVDVDPSRFLLFGGFDIAPITYVFCLVVAFAPALYRIGVDGSLADLQEQVQAGRVLGASNALLFARIILPQIWPRLCLLSSLAALWAVGDFALAKFFYDSGETLPLMIENLMASYRIDPALSLGHMVFLVGAILFFTFWRLGHVFDSKPKDAN